MLDDPGRPGSRRPCAGYATSSTSACRRWSPSSLTEVPRSLGAASRRGSRRSPSSSPGCGAVVVDSQRGGTLGQVGISAALRARDHGDDLRDRSRLRCSHQSGRHALLRSRHATSRLGTPSAYVPAQLVGAVAGALLLRLAWGGHAGRSGGNRPEHRRRVGVRLRAGPDGVPDVRDHGCRNGYASRRGRCGDCDRRDRRPRCVVRRHR